jgi:hypothetical protein
LAGKTGTTVESVHNALLQASERTQLAALMMGFHAVPFVLACAEHRLSRLVALQDRLDLEAERLASERLLLDEPRLSQRIRYEAHLRRQLIQLLRELEATQGRRRGTPVPLARLDITYDSDVDEDESPRLLEGNRR